MESLIGEALGTSRRIMTDLRPSVLDDLGLAAALEWQGAEVARRTGIRFVLHCDPEEIPVDEPRKIALFRIFQEALTNVVRHVGASRVVASLAQGGGRLRLVVDDDGCGLGTGIDHRRAHGIRGMRERADHLCGSLVEGIEEGGARIAVTLPWDPEAVAGQGRPDATIGAA
jgi:two-component system sensor histidine kinase UhpB